MIADDPVGADPFKLQFVLNTGSPAIGKGNTTYNADMGAYTSDGQGNKH